MNKYAPHIYVIPEDDRNRQIATGFVLHDQVNDARALVVPPAGGWAKVMDTFRDEYIPRLRDYAEARVVMLIDFDDQIDKRTDSFHERIPEEFSARVFVVGSKRDPETLKRELKLGFEEIGRSLAEDCRANTTIFWDHEQLGHNDAERKRLVASVKPFLFR